MNSPFSADRRKVKLLAHDPAWAEQAAAESVRLAAAIGETLVVVEHIGSTAIPGIEAKPIIDLMPVVRNLAHLDTRQAAVEALGYFWRGEWGFPGRRYCVKEENGRRLFHVHCYAAGAPDIAEHLVFRNYLRAHPDEARAYEAEKRAAAAAHPNDSLAYSEAKSDWIASCNDRAAAWAAAR